MEKEKRLIDAKDFDLRVSQKKMSEVFPNWKELPKEVQDAVCKHGEYIHMLLETQLTVDAVEVPCRMGDVVWGIARLSKGRVYVKQGVVYQMFFGEDMRLCICVKNVCRGEWGKNVFATEAEALAAIGERRTDNG